MKDKSHTYCYCEKVKAPFCSIGISKKHFSLIWKRVCAVQCPNWPFKNFPLFSGISGKLVTQFGYAVIYGAAGILQLLAITYAVFFVKSSAEIRQNKGMPNKEDISKEKPSCGNIFSLANVKQSFVVAFKKRPGGYR